jgi:hypothetical protein
MPINMAAFVIKIDKEDLTFSGEGSLSLRSKVAKRGEEAIVQFEMILKQKTLPGLMITIIPQK